MNKMTRLMDFIEDWVGPIALMGLLIFIFIYIGNIPV